MKKGYTEIIMVLDRSGSMDCIKSSTIEGVNKFLMEQKKLDGECKFTLWQFDTQHETPYNAVDLKDMPMLNNESFQPRGATALRDAICMAIDAVGHRLSLMPESQRPENVMFAIMTDGEENASREFTMSDVNDKISHQTDKYNWDFIFLGANQDAIATARSFGISAGKSMTFAHNNQGMGATMDSLSTYYTSVRSGSKTVASAMFTAEDRQKQSDAGA